MHSIDVYDNATLTANRFDDAAKSMAGALYASDGKLVPASVRSVDRSDAHIPADPGSVPRHSPVVGKHNIDGYDMYLDEAIFGGHIFAGWGHTITETISTAWAAQEIPVDVPLVMVPWGRLWVSALPRIREAINLAGWGRRRLVLASGSVVFGKVHLPERLVRFDELLHEGAHIPPRMNATYDLMIDRSLAPGEDIRKMPTFLARTRGHRRAHPHEAELETLLSRHGFRIIEGWDLSVADQIALINASSSLVGFSGSSLHNSVFAEAGIPVVEITDARASSSAKIPLQDSLCQLRGQRYERIEGYAADGGPRTVEDIFDLVDGLAVPVA